MIHDEEKGLRAGRGCVDVFFTLNQIGVKGREQKCRVQVGFYGFGDGI